MLQPLLYHDPIELNRQLQRFMQAPTLASLNLTPKACLQRAQYLLDDVAQLNEGDAYRLAEKVRELIMRHPPNHAGQHSAELKTWQRMTAAVPELFDLYAKEFEKYDGVSKPEWMRHVPYNRTADILPMRWVKMLGKGRFLDEAQSFYSYRLECGGSLHSSLEWIIGQIKGNDAARAAAFDFLNNQNSTFGVELVKALLDGTEDSLLKFFKERAPDLVKIPPERYPELTSLCGLQRASWLQLASVSEEWNNALGPFLPMHKIGVVESCEKLLAVTHLKDLEPRLADLDPSQGDPWLKWLYSISEMMIIDSVKAGRAFEQLLHLAEAADREKMEDQTRNETADEHFYAKNLVIYSSRFPTLLKLCIAVAKTSEKSMHVEALSWGISGMVKSPLEACLLVEAAGFLTDAENFDPTLSFYYIDTSSFDGGSGNRMILAFMINDAKQRDSGVRKRLLEYLPQRQPQTFGSDFIQALLEKNAAASVSAFLKVHQDELAKLPAASRKPVMDMLRKAWPKMPKLSAKSSQ